MLEEEHKEFAERVHLAQSVSAYADVLKDDSPSRGLMRFNWDPNMVVYYQSRLMTGGFNLHSAWQEIPGSAIAEDVGHNS